MKKFMKIKVIDRVIKIHGEKTPVKVVTPSFTSEGEDLMMKGGEFYGILDPDTNMWCTDEVQLFKILDKELYSYRDSISVLTSDNNYYSEDGRLIYVDSISDYDTKKMVELKGFMRNLPKNFNYHQLDNVLTYMDEEVTPDMYRSKRLKYRISEGSTDAYEKIISTLYLPEEREKLEWAIGGVLAKDNGKMEKIIAIYGKPGSGKSTIIDLINELFENYTGIFVASEIANKSNQFATEYFRNNPLVAVQDDGSLERIDSPTINEIVSHKTIAINEKGVKKYPLKPQAVLFMATNDLIDIRDTGKGIARRLLDVYPSGNKLPPDEYFDLVDKMQYELGAIADHCIKVYQKRGRKYYLNYKPMSMIERTNYIRQFIFDNYEKFISFDYYTRNEMFNWYKAYCDESNFQYYGKRDTFLEQIKEYFDEYYKVKKIENKTHRHVFGGFRRYMFEEDYGKVKLEEHLEDIPDWLKLTEKTSLFDELYSVCPAQYSVEYNGRWQPECTWNKCYTTLKDLDTRKEHFVRPPENLIVIDFDLKNEKGEKDAEANLRAASKWPKTYAEFSRSGGGLHLHYIFNGDVRELRSVIEPGIECKVFTGHSALRRRLSLSNGIPISTITSGLPLKEGSNVIQDFVVKDERHLRNLIRKALKRETNLGGTKPNIDYICMILNKAYDSGMKYDVSDLYENVMEFAASSTHHSTYCIALLSEMHFKSDEPSDNVETVAYNNKPIVIFDIESFPNLFVVCWKIKGENEPVHQLINPDPLECETLYKSYRLVGFNNRNYDNHQIYARAMGYSVEQLYHNSQLIINNKNNEGKFGEAYNLSYTDVYDFLSSQNKMGLKKWEINLGINHHENEWPWDQPVPEDKWQEIADYCSDDVLATEAVWDANESDWLAREILADLADLTVNDTTNKCTQKIIVGDAKNPQFDYIYTDLSTIFPGYRYSAKGIPKEEYNEGTKIVSGKSIYKGKDPGEGGYAIGYPGLYYNVALLDVASMHPHSAIKLKIFGEVYTARFEELVEARVLIKHGDFERAGEMLGGKLKPYLKNKKDAKKLANALKTAINSVYGLTSAKFDNKLRDPRNIDNIVAKYGALFMINLEEEVTKRGYTVVHIKTDSIKIANADNNIISFVMEYGKQYGYTFEHEATYERMYIENDAIYVAKYASPTWCSNMYNYIPEDCKDHGGEWTATGTRFKIPYVFKTLFSHEKITLADMSVVNSVTSKLYLDLNERLPEGEHDYRFIGRVGQFTPVKEGYNGGILLRYDEKKDGYAAATGTKGYRWVESDMIQVLGEDAIDRSYFDRMVDDAVETIEKCGSFSEFISGSASDFVSIPEGSEPEYDFMNPPVAA